MSYSSGGGGTVTLPSPTHIRHIDVSSAVRSLRRSITRSPSKFMDSPKSPPPFGTPTTASPSKLSDTPMGYSFQTPVQQPVHVPSPLAQPLVPSVKLSLRSAQRKNSVSSSTPAGKRTSPRSPLKRVLSESLSSANTQPRLGPTPSFVEEMGRANVVPWPATEPAYQKSQQNFMFGLDGADDSSSSPSPALFGATTPFRPAIARVDSQDHMTTSSLKRSDLMDTDQLVVDTPVAKRRSLHGSTVLGSEFNIFEHPQSNTSSPQFEIHEDPMNNIDMDKQTIDFLDSDPIFGADRPVPTFNAGGNGSATGATSVSQMPKRSSSLRKSTLSQRQDKKSGSWGRRHTHLASFENGNTPVKKDRPRASMGSLFEPPVDRGSPFAPGPLPNPSIHLFGKPQAQIATKQHPLSRSLVQSSSGNSLIEESNPPYAPALQPAKIEMEKPIISKPDFAKSMPIGAIRPKAVDNLLNQEAQFNGMATPDNFKVAKPLAGAFASTGLVSKVRMNADRMDPPTNPFKGSWRNKTMPDTPCKKTVSNNFHSLPAPSSGFAPSKIKGLRQSQSFYNSPKPDTPSDFTKSIFGVSQSSNFAISNFNSRIRSKDRKESFGSSIRDIDNFANSDIFESQSSSAGDNELPPTPTKGGYIDEFNDGGSPMRGNLFKLNGPKPRSSSKLNVTTTHSDVLSDKKKEEDSDSEFGCARVESPTPTSAHRFQSFHSAMPSTNTASSNLSFRRNRELKALAKYGKMSLGSPAPLSTQTKQLVSRRRLHSPSSPSPFIAKTPTLAGSPLFGDFQTPRTPQVDSLPDDTSRMSISGKGHLLSSRHARSTLNPPATPTTNNDAFASAGVTPVHGVKQIDIDEHLMQKFDKVEMIGQGEFSDVYRCTKQFNSFVGNQSFSFGTPGFGTPAAAKSPPSPDTSEQVYAIKKARGKFTGPKDRQNKMHEVGVLKALGKDEHIVTFIQNWEYDDILYIQMEFCEEGSLEGFLNYVGKKGRLDDFRIWKIMLELGLGIRHIHNSGFIHLDLKPANVFINFQGILKIGDFGLATTYPAEGGLEAEGDREYIAQEVLNGQITFAADIFSFGLIMLEIAGNVQLPPNGDSWIRLRSGDFSDVPSLTFSNASSIVRDEEGLPITDSFVDDDHEMAEILDSDYEMELEVKLPRGSGRKRNYNPVKRSTSHDAANLFGSSRHRGESAKAPDFMIDQYNPNSLDQIVKWMIAMKPEDRPSIGSILDNPSVQWVRDHRRAGATVYEGQWGPNEDRLALTKLFGSDDISSNSGNGGGSASGGDLEMIDV